MLAKGAFDVMLGCMAVYADGAAASVGRLHVAYAGLSAASAFVGMELEKALGLDLPETDTRATIVALKHMIEILEKGDRADVVRRH